MVKGNKGGQRGWPTLEQDAWFHCYEPLYLASQEHGIETGGLADFWPPLFEDWFARWPETVDGGQDLLDAIKKQKEVSRNFGGTRTCTNPVLDSASSSGITTIAVAPGRPIGAVAMSRC
jgi:hypothetical protein